MRRGRSGVGQDGRYGGAAGEGGAAEGVEGAGLVDFFQNRIAVIMVLGCMAFMAGFVVKGRGSGVSEGGRFTSVSSFRLADETEEARSGALHIYSQDLPRLEDGGVFTSGDQTPGRGAFNASRQAPGTGTDNGLLATADFEGASSEDLPVEAMRDYLNGMVEESVSKKPQQLSNIAFIKTHKTASTTLASILYRYGKRHDSNISKFKEGGTVVDLASAASQVAQQGKRVDIMHYHHAWNGYYSGSWQEARSQYSKIMSNEAEVNYVTVLREPISHYLSYYYYFVNPVNKLSIEEYLMRSPHKKLLYNPLAAEFGIENMAQMNNFIRNEMPLFKMVMLTERFDEGLALLQKMLNWDPIDITYCKMLQTKKGEKRWDGKPLQDVPKIPDLPPEVLAQIKARTQLDTRLYQAGILLYRKYKLEFGPGVEQHFETFQSLQQVMHRYLQLNQSSEALKWYVGSVDIYDYGPPVLRF